MDHNHGIGTLLRAAQSPGDAITEADRAALPPVVWKRSQPRYDSPVGANRLAFVGLLAFAVAFIAAALMLQAAIDRNTAAILDTPTEATGTP